VLLLPVTFAFAIVTTSIREIAELLYAYPVPIPDPPLPGLPVVMLLPVTFAFSIIRLPRREMAP
jgi:hypothetical protein